VAGTADAAKERAARFTVEQFVRPGQKVALGTGSTAALAVRALKERYPDAAFDCVASSRATEALARSVGLPVRELRADDRFDLMIDGADEVSPALDLTKGGGGALFREKLLASVSARLVIMVDASKLVPALGSRCPIPVEVVPFARPLLERELARENLGPKLRREPSGEPVRTDNGNEVIDLYLPQPLDAPRKLHDRLKSRIGVVETGLFVGMADRVVVADATGAVRELSAPRPTGP
jgi:ribose 5-phosphate isomerase A